MLNKESRMNYVPLRYTISDISQLPQCLSNNSRDLSISVSNMINSATLTGKRVSVNHTVYGTLFAYIIDAAGTIISDIQPEGMSVNDMLKELERFGFLIEWVNWPQLSGKQLSALQGIQQTFPVSKLRWISVYDSKGEAENHIVAFDYTRLSAWLDAAYSVPLKVFKQALVDGSCIEVSKVLDIEHTNWSWLKGWVANIADILEEAGHETV